MPEIFIGILIENNLSAKGTVLTNARCHWQFHILIWEDPMVSVFVLAGLVMTICMVMITGLLVTLSGAGLEIAAVTFAVSAFVTVLSVNAFDS